MNSTFTTQELLKELKEELPIKRDQVVGVSHLANELGLAIGYVSEILSGNKHSMSPSLCRRFGVVKVTTLYRFER